MNITAIMEKYNNVGEVMFEDKIEKEYSSNKVWTEIDCSCFDSIRVYVDDTSQLTLDPKWKWACKDKRNDIHLFQNKPLLHKYHKCWTVNRLYGAECNAFLDWPFSQEDFPTDLPWDNSLHEIVDGKLVHIPQRPSLDVDAKVLVWNDDKEDAVYAHFSNFTDNDRMAVWADGCTSFTAGGREHYYNNYEVIDDENNTNK